MIGDLGRSPTVQAVAVGDERPVEGAPVVGDQDRVRREVALEGVEERGLVRVVGEEQLPDDHDIPVPAAERHEEGKRPGGRAESGRLGVEAHDGSRRIDRVGHVAQRPEVHLERRPPLHDDDRACGRTEDAAADASGQQRRARWIPRRCDRPVATCQARRRGLDGRADDPAGVIG